MSIFKNFINGEWVESSDLIDNINPANIEDVIGQYGQADAEQIATAIESAHSVSSKWCNTGIQARSDALDKIGTEILARKEELGSLLAREEGKSLPEGIGEAARAGQIFKFFAGEALRIKGELVASVRPDIDVEVTREAVGTVGIITPWNFPIAIPAWKIAPALAFGNCVVFKPANQVPGSAWALSEIISRARLPNGVFNLVMGQGTSVGQMLLNDKRVDAVSFTGSVATGSKVAEACTKRGAKFQLEMGGKNPLVVLDDADIDTAVACAMNGAFYSTGQRCTASSRLIVQAGIHDRFVAALKASMQALTIGNPLDEGVQIGPVIDQAQLDKDLEYIAIGVEEGATLVTGGETLDRKAKGYFLSPALFTDTTNDMRINREEIFGPVASVIKVVDFEEALHVANETEFGLSAGICTSSLHSASQFKKRSQAGMVMVNLPTAGVDYHVPFGGTKGSSYGAREQGSYAAEFYTKVKTSYILS